MGRKTIRPEFGSYIGIRWQFCQYWTNSARKTLKNSSISALFHVFQITPIDEDERSDLNCAGSSGAVAIEFVPYFNLFS